MLYSKEDWILIHNLHVLKGYDAKRTNYRVSTWRLRGLNNLIKRRCEKPAQQIDSRPVADLAHHILLITLIKGKKVKLAHLI